MKKALFLTFAFITCFNIGSKSFADGMTEKLQPIDVYESEENAKRAYDILIKRFNVDTSFKFKQPALNYVLAFISPGVEEYYILPSKDKIVDIWANDNGVKTYEYKNEPYYYNGCEIVKDERFETVFRCVQYGDDYRFIQFKNNCKIKDCAIVEMMFYETSIKDFNEAQKNIKPQFTQPKRFRSHNYDLWELFEKIRMPITEDKSSFE